MKREKLLIDTEDIYVKPKPLFFSGEDRFGKKYDCFTFIDLEEDRYLFKKQIQDIECDVNIRGMIDVGNNPRIYHAEIIQPKKEKEIIYHANEYSVYPFANKDFLEAEIKKFIHAGYGIELHRIDDDGVHNVKIIRHVL